jgi:hypothetical protein
MFPSHDPAALEEKPQAGASMIKGQAVETGVY